jgi:hypothetical protein
LFELGEERALEGDLFFVDLAVFLGNVGFYYAEKASSFLKD